VRKGEIGAVEDFNKVQYYRQCLTNLEGEIKTFRVGGLKVDKRLLAMFITKIIVPHDKGACEFGCVSYLVCIALEHFSNLQV